MPGGASNRQHRTGKPVGHDASLEDGGTGFPSFEYERASGDGGSPPPPFTGLEFQILPTSEGLSLQFDCPSFVRNL